MANINCGHCHKTHGSVAEVRACSTRKTERPSTSGARKPAPRRASQPKLVYPNNPFFQAHLDAELVYSSGGMYNRRQLTAIVIDEFLRSGYPDEAMTCGNCGHESAWYRPTVGAIMCIGCGSVRCGQVDQATGKVEIHWTKH
jgi:ribosomal protein S27E